MKLGVMGAVFGGMRLDDALKYCQKVGLDAIELPAGGVPRRPVEARRHPQGQAAPGGARRPRSPTAAWRSTASPSTATPSTRTRRSPAAPRQAHRDGVAAGRRARHGGHQLLRLPRRRPAATRRPTWSPAPGRRTSREAAEYQWDKVLIPFWTKENDFAAKQRREDRLRGPSGLDACTTPRTSSASARPRGKNLGANLDPSHFFWQGIDPVEAARFLGENKCIFHVHAKDCAIDPQQLRASPATWTSRATAT